MGVAVVPMSINSEEGACATQPICFCFLRGDQSALAIEKGSGPLSIYIIQFSAMRYALQY